MVQTLNSKMGTGGGNVPLILGGGSLTLRMRAGCDGGGKGALIQIEKSGTLCPNNDQTLFTMQGFGDYITGGGAASSMKSRDYKDATDLIVNQNLTVRRLTPLECERLQGFPDGWTDIGAWTDDNGKTHTESTDSARYKALGNSIALPPWAYVLTRLSLCVGTERPTMASLFDGIGGFPLIWEWLNGKGTCLWASEIEPFPIAVTKRHFPEEGTNYENGPSGLIPK